MKTKNLKDVKFHELVSEATREIHDGLLKNGGDGLRQAVYTYMTTAIQWKETQDKKDGT